MTTNKPNDLFDLFPPLNASGSATAEPPVIAGDRPELLTLEAEGDVEWIEAAGEGAKAKTTPRRSSPWSRTAAARCNRPAGAAT